MICDTMVNTQTHTKYRERERQLSTDYAINSASRKLKSPPRLTISCPYW